MEWKILDSLDRQAGVKAHGAASMMHLPGQPSFTEHDYIKIAKEGYMKNSAVYSAVNFGAKVFASVDVQLFDTAGGQKQELKDNPLLDLISRPNEDTGRASFMKQKYSFFKLAGKDYTRMLWPDSGPNAGVPQQLVSYLPSNVTPLQGDDNLIGGFELKNHNQKRLDKEEVIYVNDFHPTNIADGHPAAMSVARAVDVTNMMLEWNMSVLENSGMPAHLFKGGWTQEQAKKWRQQNERETTGPARAGRDLYLPDHVDAERLGMDSRELDWINGLINLYRMIYAAYGLPAELFNDSEAKTYSNFESAIKAIILFDTIPVWRIFLDEWNYKLVPRFGDSLELDINKEFIEAITQEMMDKISKGIEMYQSEFASRGEAREFAGFDQGDEPDRTVLRSSFIPTDLADTAPPDLDVNPDDIEVTTNGEDA